MPKFTMSPSGLIASGAVIIEQEKSTVVLSSAQIIRATVYVAKRQEH